MTDSLAKQTPKDTFGRLLQIANGNDGLDSTLRPIMDGKGEASPLRMSNAAVEVDGPITLQSAMIILVSASSDSAAASLGVPVNGLYRSGNAVQIRLA